MKCNRSSQSSRAQSLWRSLTPFARASTILLPGVVLCSPATAQCQTAAEVAKVLVSGGADFNQFGYSVAFSGNTMVVGVPYHEEAGQDNRGAVYVYTRANPLANWILQQKILAADGEAEDKFGFSVAIDGETLIAGATKADGSTGPDTGAAYVFARAGTTWSLQGRLEPDVSDVSGDYWFGKGVAISGTLVAVAGLYNESDPRAFFKTFSRSGSTWSPLTNSVRTVADPYREEHCENLAIANGRILYGVRFDGVSPIASGRVRVYERVSGVWVNTQTLAPAVASTTQDEFGFAISARGDDVLIGAPQDSRPGLPMVGAVYHFRATNGTFNQLQKIVPLDPETNNAFGLAVSLASSDFAAIGAPYKGATGVVYPFALSGGLWQQQGDPVGPGTEGQYVGYSVAASGIATSFRSIMAGSPHTNTPDGTWAGAVHSFKATTTEWTSQRVVASTLRNGDGLGSAIAVDGMFAVVGASREDSVEGLDAGAAYVLGRTRGSWVRTQTLRPAGLDPSDTFGASVDISGTTMVIGLPNDEAPNATDGGSVYIYNLVDDPNSTIDTWQLLGRIVASDAQAGDNFGTSVDLFGNTLIVGSPNDDVAGGTDQGSAYIFTKTNGVWGGEVKLLASDRVTGDKFGIAVSLGSVGTITSNPVALVGAYGNNAAGSNSGAAYAFRLEPIIGGVAWTEKQKLVPADLGPSENFGNAISLSGSTAVIGCLLNEHLGSFERGAAYVYVANSTGSAWTEQTKLVATDGVTGDRFGTSVGISGNSVIIGSSRDDNGLASDSGSAYLFRRTGTTWAQQQRIRATDQSEGDNYGTAVAINSDVIAIGAPLEDNVGGTDAGAAYMLEYSTLSPTIQSQPVSVTTCRDGNAMFSVTSNSTGPLSYRWYRNNVALNDEPQHRDGSFQSTLSISDARLSDAGIYTVVVTNPCGFVVSNAVTLSVCPADLDDGSGTNTCDGGVTIEDLLYFVAAFAQGDLTVDLDNGTGTGTQDQGVTIDDLVYFLQHFTEGC